MTGKHFRETEEQEREVAEPVVVRDRRKIDPETGQVRQQPETAAPEPTEGSGPSLGESIVDEAVAAESDVEKQLAERTADLQRLQAEYANYRKRVDRDRETVVNNAKAGVVADLLPLLDDLERAEQHGDLTGAFKAVADKLVAGLQRAGLTPFGTEGEPFDPSVHEAVQHSTSPEVSGPTVTTVLRRGYQFGDRVLRAALVGVTDHEPGAAEAAPVDAPVEGELPVEQLSNENNQQ
ncbi:nucleotide exchange factor GrpE [Amycolatopsis sp. K13G38]|uniref:Protein GrpE n=1 Tax=Amycolatopsis acididurans TaxID=2724524 RepID=A0ABX1J7T4_9PSEU|nr:nucleotide exchange factor GrpE [Amycolatopsis acididurans]NKQ55860.1 nucleotide exchange factor GrpE [Amycolatopsis acididurans]